jgi:hypothetical protein
VDALDRGEAAVRDETGRDRSSGMTAAIPFGGSFTDRVALGFGGGRRVRLFGLVPRRTDFLGTRLIAPCGHMKIAPPVGTREAGLSALRSP